MNSWRWPAAVGFRYLDMVVWGVRYVIAFAITGKVLPLAGAAVVTASAQAAMLTPVQFGLREWVVGVVSGVLPEEYGVKAAGSSSPQEGAGGETKNDIITAATPGLLADVVMRAAEMVVILPVGGLSVAWMVRSVARRGRTAASGEAGSLADHTDLPRSR